MSDTDRQRVFEPFVQLDKEAALKWGGAGLGLALSRELVELHGGTLVAEPGPTSGTRMSASIPRVIPSEGHGDETLSHRTLREQIVRGSYGEVTPDDDRDERAIHRLEEQESQPLNARDPEDAVTVLVVDDNEELRLFVAKHLRGLYRVLEAGDGLEALAVAREAQPDLVITDWMMPEMSGVELCEALRQDRRTSHLPIILLTALDDVVEGLERGADDFLEKPFEPRELRARVTSLLRSRRLVKQHFAPLASLELQIEESANEEDRAFADRLQATIGEQFEDETLGVSELARAMGMSRSSFYRRTAELLNESPAALLKGYRLDRAMDALKSTDLSVTDIAYGCGFASLGHFSRSFKERFGVAPSEVG